MGVFYSLSVCRFLFSSKKKQEKLCVISHLAYLFTWKLFHIACSVIFVTLQRVFRLWLFSLQIFKEKQHTLDWMAYTEKERKMVQVLAHKSKICNEMIQEKRREIGNTYAMYATIMHGRYFQWCDYDINNNVPFHAQFAMPRESYPTRLF